MASGERPGQEPEVFEVTVVPHQGRFAVEVVAVFADGAVRHRVSDHVTRRQAEVAAAMVRKGAERPGM